MTECDPWIGKQLGKYRIVRAIGKGGMGIVYQADDTRLQRPVALKLVPERYSKDESVLKRFLLEARAAARLSHPNVVAVYDIGQRGRTYYLAMELVRGVNLQHVLNTRGALSWADATWICAEVCRGLAAAHAAGLIHRDIKPSNILVTGAGVPESAISEEKLPASEAAGPWPAGSVVKIADFGLAKFAVQSFPRLTAVNSTVGTPAYMSPEQCRNERLDALTDIYSLGVTYFTLMVGRPPYGDGNDMNALAAHCISQVPDPRQYRPEVPAACAAIVLRAMAKLRSKRFSGAEEMLSALSAVLLTKPASPVVPATLPPLPEPADSKEKTRLLHPPGTARPWRWGWALAAIPLLVVAVAACSGLTSMYWWRDSADAPAVPPDPAPVPPPLAVGPPPAPPAELLTLRPLRTLDAHRATLTGLAFAPDGKRLICTAGQTVYIWDTGSGDLRQSFEATSNIGALAVFPNGVDLAIGTHKRNVYFRGLDQGDARGGFGPVNGEVMAMAIAPDGKWLALSTGGGLEVWDVTAAPRRQYVHPKHQYNITSVAFSADSKALAWVNYDAEVHVIDTTLWHSIADNTQKKGDLSAVLFTPDGNSVLYGGRTTAGRGILARWDFARPGEQPRTLADDKGEIRTLALLPSGRNLLFGGEWGGPLLQLDLETERQRPGAVVGNTALQRLAVSSDGRLVAGGTDNGKIQLWEAIPEHAEMPQ